MNETGMMQRTTADLGAGAAGEYDVSDVVGQVQKIQQAMKAIMKEGEHYGKIPGCGDKPSLLKPGAEKLGFMFRLAPKFERESIDLGGGHREIVIRCELTHIASGIIMGEGVGSCSTMEGKYRFRTGPKEFTGCPVPSEYWDLRKSDPEGALALIGGHGFSTGKNDGKWEIVRAGERVEHDNPADHYNTILKMAKKRAHVDAILTVTAASDIFTQDLEDLAANGVIGAPPHQQSQSPAKVPEMPQRRSEEPAAAPSGGDGDSDVISEAQRKRFYAIWKNAGIPEDIVRTKLRESGYQHSKDIRKGDYKALCAWAENFGKGEPGQDG